MLFVNKCFKQVSKKLNQKLKKKSEFNKKEFLKIIIIL